MKAFYYFSFLAVLLITVCSCKDNNEDPTPEQPTFSIAIEEDDTRPTLSEDGGTVTIPFTATADWTANLMNDRAEGWVTISPTSGKAGDVLLTIIATANDTYDERNATIVLKCGDDTENIVVTQKQKDAILLSSSKYEVPSEGGEINVEVQANVSFEVEIEADWIKQIESRALSTSSLNLSIDPNETAETREGEITIKSGELSETIHVYQGFDNFIVLTQKEYTLPEEGGTIDVEIRSTVDYGVKILDNVDWIAEVETRAVSTHTHHYQIAPNESYDAREAKIVFYSLEDESLADTLSIYQVQLGAIVVARNEYQFDVNGGKLELTVQSNLEFDVLISDDWIQQTLSTRGLVDYELAFIIAENKDGKDREGTIAIKDKSSDKQQVITIKQSYVDLEREALIALYKATNGDNWTHNDNWCSDKPIGEWYGVIKNPDGSLLIGLDNNNLVGYLPDEMRNLKNLESLIISDNQIEKLPDWIGELGNLEMLVANNSNLSGSIPKEIGCLKKLRVLHLYTNNLSGSILEEICNLTELESLNLSYNNLSKTIPGRIGNLRKMIYIELDDNQLEGDLPQSLEYLMQLERLSVPNNNLVGNVPAFFANMPKLVDLRLYGNCLSGAIPEELYKCPNWKKWQALTRIYDQQKGYVLYPEGYYESTDFSKDGEVLTLQTHQKGNGIKLILMGDLFVDKDMGSGGFYEKVMKETMEAYFSIEPLKSLREYFDVISIKAVSRYNWQSGETAFETISQNGIKYNKEKCMEYAQKAISGNSLDNVSVIMVPYFGFDDIGGIGLGNTYSNGFNIMLCTYGYVEDNFEQGIRWSTGSMAGLADEFFESYEEDVFTDFALLDQKHDMGWCANVDYISDPEKVYWAHFINDLRYAGECIGIFEGAYGYRYGIYRATEYSILGGAIVQDDGSLYKVINQFNAPSREAIYKQVMKLAYGDSWVYDYEEFVKFDAQGHADFVAAKNKAQTRSISSSSKRTIKHTPPRFYYYPAVVK